MGATKYKIIIKKNSVNMILDAIKGKHDIKMFYLKEKIYAPKVVSPHETDINLSE